MSHRENKPQECVFGLHLCPTSRKSDSWAAHFACSTVALSIAGLISLHPKGLLGYCSACVSRQKWAPYLAAFGAPLASGGRLGLPPLSLITRGRDQFSVKPRTHQRDRESRNSNIHLRRVRRQEDASRPPRPFLAARTATFWAPQTSHKHSTYKGGPNKRRSKTWSKKCGETISASSLLLSQKRLWQIRNANLQQTGPISQDWTRQSGCWEFSLLEQASNQLISKEAPENKELRN